MAKRKQQSLDIDVKGLSTEQILNMDVNEINSMNYRTIRALASRLVSSMNKRIRSLTKKAPNSLALNSLPQGHQFSTKGMNRNQIRSLIGEMQSFGKMKTSTVTGWKEYRTNIEKKLGGRLSDLSMGESEFWKLYREIKESNNALYQIFDSDKILKEVYDVVVDDPEDPMSRIQETLDNLYDVEMGNFTEDDLWGDEDEEDYF